MLVLSQAAESAGEQFEEQPLVEAEIRSVIGNTYRSLGKYNDAESHLVESLAVRRRVLGDEHPSTLESIGAMGGLLSNQGKYEEAMPYYVEALETRRRVLGDEHPSTLWSIGAMGGLLHKQGKYDEAMPYYVEALEGRRRVLGDEHPDTLRSIGNMGKLLLRQGKHDEAIKTAWDSPQLLNELAWIIAISDDKVFFTTVSDDVLIASQRSCELTDYENAMYIDTLARVHFERGEFDEAIKWQELAMQHIPQGDDKGTYQGSLDRYREAAKQDAQE
jgi:tetratricopeptide (TPR) repeat protein